MKTIYFIRHAESEENRRLLRWVRTFRTLATGAIPNPSDIRLAFEMCRITENVDSPLSAQGRDQIKDMRKLLDKEDFYKKSGIELVAHSPLTRAKETAQGMLPAHAKMEQLDCLREKKLKEWFVKEPFLDRIRQVEEWIDQQEATTICLVGHSQHFKKMLQLKRKFGNCNVMRTTYDGTWSTDIELAHKCERQQEPMWENAAPETAPHEEWTPQDIVKALYLTDLQPSSIPRGFWLALVSYLRGLLGGTSTLVIGTMFGTVQEKVVGFFKGLTIGLFYFATLPFVGVLFGLLHIFRGIMNYPARLLTLMSLKLPGLRPVQSTSRVLIEEIDTKSSQSEVLNACNQCKKRASRYSCARCSSFDYCSVECYKQHSCSEQFYQNQVLRVQNVEREQSKQETLDMLCRVHDQHDSLETFGEKEEPNTTREDFINILAEMEQREAKGEELDPSFLSPEMQKAFSQAVTSQSKEITDWILEPWTPWWLESVEVDQETDEEHAPSLLIQGKTLDEHLLELPRVKTSQPLQFNCIDLVSAVIQTLLNFHGLPNALQSRKAAGEELIDTSKVLSMDARYKNVDEVESVHESTWMILKHRRMVLRALIEGKILLRKKYAKKMEFYAAWVKEKYVEPC